MGRDIQRETRVVSPLSTNIESGCVNVRRQLTKKSMERMHLPKRFWCSEYNRISEGAHRVAATRYIEQVDIAMERGYGMILWGDNSVGKTAIAAVLMKEVRRRGYIALFTTASQFISSVIQRVEYDDAHTVQQRCHSVDLLVIDDLGKESSVSASKKDVMESMIENLIRFRSSNLKSTIITSNIDPSVIRGRYSDSMWKIMKESNAIIKVVGPSQREIEKQDLIQFFTR